MDKTGPYSGRRLTSKSFKKSKSFVHSSGSTRISPPTEYPFNPSRPLISSNEVSF